MQVRYRLSNIEKTAKDVYDAYKSFKVWAFDAQMGAGKTTFIHALCHVLGVQEAVTSPTFAIINEYLSAGGLSICHMDWYRLKDEAEAIDAGVEDYLYTSDLCLVEWPRKAEALLPGNTLWISIEIVNEDSRIMHFRIPQAE